MTLDILFLIGGAAIVLHVIVCFTLQRRLVSNQELLESLFVVPVGLLSKGVGPRMLRARYYLPWIMTGIEKFEVNGLTRALVFVARITGMLIPVGLIAFLAGSVYEGVAGF